MNLNALKPPWIEWRKADEAPGAVLSPSLQPFPFVSP